MRSGKLKTRLPIRVREEIQIKNCKWRDEIWNNKLRAETKKYRTKEEDQRREMNRRKEKKKEDVLRKEIKEGKKKKRKGKK